MNFSLLTSSLLFAMKANVMIDKDPGIIVGPITEVLGFIMNFLNNFSASLFPSSINHLVISIILLTILVKLIMLPLSIKQQKSMVFTRRLDPEKDKITKKYADLKDPESKQKMNQEIQQLYTSNGVNPLAGCLPILIQLPIFVALNTLMRQTHLFIRELGTIYDQISAVILGLPGYLDGKTNEYFIYFNNTFVQPLLGNSKITLNLLTPEGITKATSKLTDLQWADFFSFIPPEATAQIQELLLQKSAIENLGGISLIDTAGYLWPGILIPLLSGVTTFLSSYYMMKNQPAPMEGSAAQTQKMMLYGMPFMMAFVTVSFPIGVGIYWITSNIVQIVQQLCLNKYFNSERIIEKMNLEADTKKQTLLDKKNIKNNKQK